MVIYLTRNTINNKIYIGQDQHNRKSYYGSGIMITRAIKKYGKENFTKTILDECSSIKELNKREIYWIEKLDTRNTKVGYNIMEGGSGYIKSKGYCEHTREWKAKLSKPVLQYDKEMNLLNEFDSIKEAAKITGLYPQNIGICAKSKKGFIRKTGGFIWRYKKEEDRLQGHLKKEFNMPKHSEETLEKMRNPKSKSHKNKIASALKGVPKSEEAISNMKITKRKKSKSIIQFDKEGNKIKEWNSIVDIFEQLGFNRFGIHQCCNGKAKQAYGFVWKYLYPLNPFIGISSSR